MRDRVVVRVDDRWRLPVGDSEGLGLNESLALPGDCEGLGVARTEAVKEALFERVRLSVRLRLKGLSVGVQVGVRLGVKVNVRLEGVHVETLGDGEIEKVMVVDMAKVSEGVRVTEAVPVSDTS